VVAKARMKCTGSVNEMSWVLDLFKCSSTPLKDFNRMKNGEWGCSKKAHYEGLINNPTAGQQYTRQVPNVIKVTGSGTYVAHGAFYYEDTHNGSIQYTFHLRYSNIVYVITP
jgi:hypothetical protein